jgi:tRNA pseudouridine55 synthase
MDSADSKTSAPGLKLMHGILLVDKPKGITANKVVGIVKRNVKPSKVGHTGTLDPAATGLMVILIGSGTRTLDYLDEHRKGYSLQVRLGEESDTGDREGKIIRTGDPTGITLDRLEEVLAKYRGVFDQVPPHFAAIKKNGVPLYKLARKGVFPDLPPRKVEVFVLEAKNWDCPLLELDLVCSKGTYARALARDIGRDLNVGGRLESLRRTSSGRFKIEDALTLDEIRSGETRVIREHLISLLMALSHIPDILIIPQDVRRLMRGNPVIFPRSRLGELKIIQAQPPRLFKVAYDDGGVLILVRPEPRGPDLLMRPVRIFNTHDDLD